nr:MAG TPA: hypothetical protein [Caudoviricetes sp.]
MFFKIIYRKGLHYLQRMFIFILFAINIKYYDKQ